MALVTVVGGGLAGAECAHQLARQGVRVRLCEQKPLTRTAACETDQLAELVCSNSLRAAALHNAVGLLKEEMRRAGSLIIACADETRVPAGGALAVDRVRFSAEVTRRIDESPLIERVAERVERIPDARPLVLATGPLTGDGLAADIAAKLGREHLAYYDSVAPIVTAESIDLERVFAASRYDKGGDSAYLNCPLDEGQYRAFVAALCEAEKIALHSFEKPRYFEGCLPIEVLAERGVDTLAFGPMKPVGLLDPRTGKRPHAVVQLRREDGEGTAYNLVGFQTRMTQPEQRRVLALIPGLERARFERFGSVHRNTFVNAPEVLDDALQAHALPGVYLAGQITGVEGYVESAACGMCVGLMLAARLQGRAASPPPPTTALGALLSHLRRPSSDFQPSNVVFSMFAPLSGSSPRRRKDRREALASRALEDVREWIAVICGHGLSLVDAAPAIEA
ncbi:MAG: methylenetetrahydrofolate--tRNA-(uracil(54)-C(5))-methyltransferase (FADH(2)-oxidizing) TrmFO [Polyangiales bacterium]